MIGTRLGAAARRLPPRRRVWVAGGALLVVALLAIGVGFVPATHGSRAASSAASQSGGMRLVSVVCNDGDTGGCYLMHDENGDCLDADYNGHVQGNPCWSDDNYQVWYDMGDTYRNNETRMCLDSDYNGDLYTSPCWDNDQYQIWDWKVETIVFGEPGAQTTTDVDLLANRQTGLCLKTDGPDADDNYHTYTTSCDRHGFQGWLRWWV